MENETETNPQPSNKRKIAAAVTAGVVTVVLTMAANNLIDRATKKVQNQIAPEKAAAE